MSLMNKIGLEKSGTLLVLFPLICQVTFVIALFFPLLNLQSNISRLSKSGELISKTISLMNHTMNLGYVAKLNGNQPTGEAMQREVRAGEIVREQLAEIREAAGDDSHRLMMIDGMTKGAEAIIGDLATTREEFKRGIHHFRKVNSKYDKSIRNAIRYMLNSADSMIAEEETMKDEVLLRTQQEWKILNAFLISAIALSTIIAFGLAAVYVRAILLPLKHLNANCLRVVNQQDLLPVLNGSQEFTQLDELLHAITNATKEEQEKERAMVNNTNDLICSLNTNLEFLRANQSTINFFGTGEENIVGRSVFDFLAPEDQKHAGDCLRAAMNAETSESFEFRVKAIDTEGDNKYIHTRWSCLFSQQSQELFAVVHDIDEEKIIEGMKQDFVDMVSHDLRSPLSSMHVALDLVACGTYGEVSQEAHKELEGARRNLNRLLDFVNDLLDFQKLKHGEMELECSSTNVEELVQSAVDLVRPAIEARNLQIKTEGEEMSIVADGKKLNQVLTNLLANAIRYTPRGGEISVEWNRTASDFQISVSDTGPGIAEEHRKHNFEAFEQTPEAIGKGEGTGLGLAICKLICDAHRGSISVGNSPLKGSKFTVSIPTSEA